MALPGRQAVISEGGCPGGPGPQAVVQSFPYSLPGGKKKDWVPKRKTAMKDCNVLEQPRQEGFFNSPEVNKKCYCSRTPTFNYFLFYYILFYYYCHHHCHCFSSMLTALRPASVHSSGSQRRSLRTSKWFLKQEKLLSKQQQKSVETRIHVADKRGKHSGLGGTEPALTLHPLECPGPLRSSRETIWEPITRYN